MKRGITFEIPNEYGTFLNEIVKPIDITAFKWKIGYDTEAYIVNNNFDTPLFPENKEFLKGAELKRSLLNSHISYVIFADLKAYTEGEFVEINTYEEFIASNCQIVLLVVDSCYVTIYCKEKEQIELLYKHAIQCRFKDISYITDENDTRTRLYIW